MGVAKVAAPPLGGSTKLVIQLTSIQTSHDSKLRNLGKVWKSSAQGTIPSAGFENGGGGV